MATPARDSNGHFIKRTEQPSGEPAGSVPVDAGTAPLQNDGVVDTFVNPAEAARKRNTGSGRGPGRPKGTSKKEGKAEETLAVERPAPSGKIDLDSLNFTLFYAHSLLAKATASPELELDKEEARALSTACMNVMQHYNIKASQKAIDWGNLVLTGVIMYGGKFHAISERQKKERAEKRAEAVREAAPFMGNG